MDQAQPKILIVEDDPSIAGFVGLELGHTGFLVRKVSDGAAALDAVREFQPDVVVMDVMLPGMDGLEVTRRLREAGDSRPIIMLTARSETQDVVTGFDVGADDYLRKPFEIAELVSRIKRLLKAVETDKAPTSYKVGHVEVDPSSRTVKVADEVIKFTAKEYDLLEYFMTNAGRVISRDEILEKVWGGQHTSESNVIEVFVCHLRNKIGDHDNQMIRTIRGVGYFFSRV